MKHVRLGGHVTTERDRLGHEYLHERTRKKPELIDKYQNNVAFTPERLEFKSAFVADIINPITHHSLDVAPTSEDVYYKGVEERLKRNFLRLYDSHTKQYLPQEEKDKQTLSFLKSLTGFDADLVRRADESARSLIRAGSHSLREHGIGTLKPTDIGAKFDVPSDPKPVKEEEFEFEFDMEDGSGASASSSLPASLKKAASLAQAPSEYDEYPLNKLFTLLGVSMEEARDIMSRSPIEQERERKRLYEIFKGSGTKIARRRRGIQKRGR